MGKMSKKDMEELREMCSLGCDYSGTEETVQELVYDTLKVLNHGEEQMSADEVGLMDFDNNEFGTLDDFVRIFWEKAVESILNVVETQSE